jgi:hypothetical protein
LQSTRLNGRPHASRDQIGTHRGSRPGRHESKLNMDALIGGHRAWSARRDARWGEWDRSAGPVASRREIRPLSIEAEQEPLTGGQGVLV